MEAQVRIEPSYRLPAADLDAVSALVDAATEADGAHPLSEHAVLALLQAGAEAEGDAADDDSRHSERHAPHVLVFRQTDDQPEQLVGYAHVDDLPAVDGAAPVALSAELVVLPSARGHGVGRLLVEELSRAAPEGRLRVWAHGRLPAAAALAASTGMVVGRELWQMRRSLTQPLPPAPVPAGLRLRSFRPGADDAAWVALNAGAFAHHPEQGSWTAADLLVRQAEPWFDADGFLLLEDDAGALAGFHWTKVHPGELGKTGEGGAEGSTGSTGSTEASPVGEVYVVGVSPEHQGRGLGRVLTVAGLQHLRSRGLPEAMLYVDADNAAAVRTYERLGFAPRHVDVQYVTP